MRFVVLHHFGWAGRPDHYDLMLETELGDEDDERSLMAFSTRSDAFPDPDAEHQSGCHLEPIDDHRRVYLAFEGALSGDRGHVTRVDEGRLEWIVGPREEEKDLVFQLAGRQLNGMYILHRNDERTFEFRRRTQE